MDLILVRHAEAAPAEGQRPDAERTLTDRGREDARRSAAALAALSPPRPRILCSPKIRALETARFFAGAFQVEEIGVIETLAGDRTTKELLQETLVQECDCLLLVGHQPDIGRFLTELLDLDSPQGIRFPAGGFAWIEFAGPCALRSGRLRAFIHPSTLA